MLSVAYTNAKPRALQSEHGATMLEYALIVACVCILCIASVAVVGTETSQTFQTVGDKLANGNIPVVIDIPP